MFTANRSDPTVPSLQRKESLNKRGKFAAPFFQFTIPANKPILKQKTSEMSTIGHSTKQLMRNTCANVLSRIGGQSQTLLPSPQKLALPAKIVITLFC